MTWNIHCSLPTLGSRQTKMNRFYQTWKSFHWGSTDSPTGTKFWRLRKVSDPLLLLCQSQKPFRVLIWANLQYFQPQTDLNQMVFLEYESQELYVESYQVCFHYKILFRLLWKLLKTVSVVYNNFHSEVIFEFASMKNNLPDPKQKVIAFIRDIQLMLTRWRPQLIKLERYPIRNGRSA